MYGAAIAANGAFSIIPLRDFIVNWVRTFTTEFHTKSLSNLRLEYSDRNERMERVEYSTLGDQLNG